MLITQNDLIARRREYTSLPILELHDLVSEIEILEFVLYLVNRNNDNGCGGDKR